MDSSPPEHTDPERPTPLFRVPYPPPNEYADDDDFPPTPTYEIDQNPVLVRTPEDNIKTRTYHAHEARPPNDAIPYSAGPAFLPNTSWNIQRRISSLPLREFDATMAGPAQPKQDLMFKQPSPQPQAAHVAGNVTSFQSQRREISNSTDRSDEYTFTATGLARTLQTIWAHDMPKDPQEIQQGIKMALEVLVKEYEQRSSKKTESRRVTAIPEEEEHDIGKRLGHRRIKTVQTIMTSDDEAPRKHGHKRTKSTIAAVPLPAPLQIHREPSPDLGLAIPSMTTNPYPGDFPVPPPYNPPFQVPAGFLLPRHPLPPLQPMRTTGLPQREREVKTLKYLQHLSDFISHHQEQHDTDSEFIAALQQQLAVSQHHLQHALHANVFIQQEMNQSASRELGLHRRVESLEVENRRLKNSLIGGAGAHDQQSLHSAPVLTRSGTPPEVYQQRKRHSLHDKTGRSILQGMYPSRDAPGGSVETSYNIHEPLGVAASAARRSALFDSAKNIYGSGSGAAQIEHYPNALLEHEKARPTAADDFVIRMKKPRGVAATDGSAKIQAGQAKIREQEQIKNMADAHCKENKSKEVAAHGALGSPSKKKQPQEATVESDSDGKEFENVKEMMDVYKQRCEKYEEILRATGKR